MVPTARWTVNRPRPITYHTPTVVTTNMLTKATSSWTHQQTVSKDLLQSVSLRLVEVGKGLRAFWNGNLGMFRWKKVHVSSLHFLYDLFVHFAVTLSRDKYSRGRPASCSNVCSCCLARLLVRVFPVLHKNALFFVTAFPFNSIYLKVTTFTLILNCRSIRKFKSPVLIF